jgi:hypothetical protein
MLEFKHFSNGEPGISANGGIQTSPDQKETNVFENESFETLKTQSHWKKFLEQGNVTVVWRKRGERVVMKFQVINSQ